MVNKILLKYVKENYPKFKIEDIESKILSKGGTQEEIDEIKKKLKIVPELPELKQVPTVEEVPELVEVEKQEIVEPIPLDEEPIIQQPVIQQQPVPLSNPIVGLEQQVVKDPEIEKKQSFWEKLFNKKRLKKPETVSILYLRENSIAQPMFVEPRNEMINIEGKTYHQKRDCTYQIGKDRIPLLIIREEGLLPEGTKEYWEDQDSQKRCQEHQDFAIKAIRHAEIVRMGYDDGKKGKFNMKLGIAVVLLLIIGYALMQGGLL